jgi:dihydrofolate reductase
MGKLILEEWISLDGYASDKERKLDFFAPHVRTSYDSPERMAYRNAIDTILLGAKTYTQFSALWPSRTAEENILAEKMNAAQKIVFSKSLQEAPWGKWTPALVERRDPLTAVRQLKSGTCGNIVIWGSISLAQALMYGDVIDEYHIHICPVTTGGGQKLFADGMAASALQLVNMHSYGPGITHLHYLKTQ